MTQTKKNYRDIIHSGREKRYILLGATKTQRILFAVFTVRRGRIRIISARDLNKKELYLYEKKNQLMCQNLKTKNKREDFGQRLIFPAILRRETLNQSLFPTLNLLLSL